MKKAFKVMNELRSQNLLCDVTIVAEDMEISAHRVVLAACSPYFHAMFTGTSPSSWCEFLESQLHPVNCLGIRAFADMHACTDLLNKANTYAGKWSRPQLNLGGNCLVFDMILQWSLESHVLFLDLGFINIHLKSYNGHTA
ncbi:kelch-like protein 2 isoform X1 [Pan troglodytes]|uniref:kelch-like protein 2 isoform X1 n=1 Tax=Pan troglodytes TaxID=9598 RepID=UPI00301336C6